MLIAAGYEFVKEHTTLMLYSSVAFVGIGYSCYSLYNSPTFSVHMRTWMIDKLGWRMNDGVRSSFQNNFKLHPRGAPAGHSHPSAAALRTAVNCAVNDWCVGDGNAVYSVSGSTRDGDNVGYHQYYMAKDVCVKPSNKALLDTHVLKMIDVDYYVDMKAWMSYGRPAVIYTFVPNTVAGSVTEGCFCIKDNWIKYYVSGGAEYRHQIWDYTTDWLVFDYWWGSYVCSVEHREVEPDRRVIIITPEIKIRGPVGWFLPGRRLQRVDFQFGHGVNRLDYIDQTGDRYVSIGLEDSFVSVKLRYALFEAIRIRLANCKKAEIHAVERYLNKHPEEFPNPDETAAHLFEIFQRTTKFGNAHLIPAGGLVQMVTGYQAVGPASSGFLVTEDGKKIGRAVAPSLVDNPGVVPNESYNNDLACVIGRVQRPYNSVAPPARFSKYAQEFAEFLVPRPGIGSPWSIEQVLAVQEKPAQRGRNERVVDWLTDDDHVFVSAFMKHESYGSVNDPRNISQVPTEHTLRLSSYTYPFKIDILKEQRWYGCGMTPTEIAIRVNEICSSFDAVSEIDYTRWDGSFSIWMRAFMERAVYLRWCNPKYRKELGGLLEAEVAAKAKTRNGVPYIPAGARESGSALTSDSNSVGGAEVAYFAAREAGMEPQQSWDMLGIFVGDDGVTGIRACYMESAAKELGLKLKCETRYRGEPVHFLGRVFFDPFTGLASMQDPVRTLKKLHISFADKSVPDDVALYNRASGYLTLDPNAPIISSWCVKVLENITKINPKITEHILKHYPLIEKDLPYYARFTETFPQLARNDPLAYEVFANELGVDVITVHTWEHEILSCNSLFDVEALIHVEREDKIPAVTDEGLCLPIAGTARMSAPMPNIGEVRRRYRSAADRLDECGVLGHPKHRDATPVSKRNRERAKRWRRSRE